MKKIDYEKGLVRMAWAFAVLGGAGLILFLALHIPSKLSIIILSLLLVMAAVLSHHIVKFFTILLGVFMAVLLTRFFVKGFCYKDINGQQEVNTKKVRKRIIISIIVIVLTVFGGGGYLVHALYWQTHTGSRNGQVFDANTGKPIEGAVVNYTWKVAGFMQNAIGGGGPTVSHETLTDKEGKYYIPSFRVKRSNVFQLGLQPEEVLVYKDKYAVYKLLWQYEKAPVGRSFGYQRKNQPYLKKDNVVKLYRFKEGESHDNHVFGIDSWTRSSSENKLLMKELGPEKERAREENLKKWRQQ